MVDQLTAQENAALLNRPTDDIDVSSAEGLDAAYQFYSMLAKAQRELERDIKKAQAINKLLETRKKDLERNIATKMLGFSKNMVLAGEKVIAEAYYTTVVDVDNFDIDSDFQKQWPQYVRSKIKVSNEVDKIALKKTLEACPDAVPFARLKKNYHVNFKLNPEAVLEEPNEP